MGTFTITLTEKQQQFITAYFEAVCFTEELEQHELDDLWVEEQTIDCLCFYNDAYCYLSDGTTEQAGHDFWLTRNGHGVGFWDRPEIYGSLVSEDLADRADWFGEVYAVTSEEN